MTTVLWGRWQTRAAVLLTLGALISLIFALSYNPEGRNDGNPGSLNEDFFIVLLAVLVIGWVWDILWFLLQKMRWDRDWPPAFAWFSALCEGILIWFLLDNGLLPFIPKEEAPPFWVYFWHYTLVYFVTFFWTQTFMRAFFPHWRYFGGRLV